MATQVGDTVNLSVYNSGGTLFAGPLTHVITSGDFAAGIFNLSSGILVNGNVYYGEAWVSRSGYSDSVHAQSGTFTSPAAAAPTATFVAMTIQSDATAYSIGSGYSGRRVVLTLGSNWSGAAIVSATICGVAATIHVQDSTLSQANSAIISAIVPTGTTFTPSTDLVITWSASEFFSQCIGIYTVNDGLIVTKTPTVAHTNGASVTSLALAGLTVPAGAIIFGATGYQLGNDKTPFSMTDTQADAFTENQYQNGITSFANGTTGGTATITSTWTGSYNAALCVAIWR